MDYFPAYELDFAAVYSFYCRRQLLDRQITTPNLIHCPSIGQCPLSNAYYCGVDCIASGALWEGDEARAKANPPPFLFCSYVRHLILKIEKRKTFEILPEGGCPVHSWKQCPVKPGLNTSDFCILLAASMFSDVVSQQCPLNAKFWHITYNTL